MQPWLGERVRQELDRKYGKDHGIPFEWGHEDCEPEFWDNVFCPWRLMINPRRATKANYKGQGNMTTCLRHQIKCFFKFYKEDINKYTKDNPVEERKRMAKRGPRTVQHSNSDSDRESGGPALTPVSTPDQHSESSEFDTSTMSVAPRRSAMNKSRESPDRKRLRTSAPPLPHIDMDSTCSTLPSPVQKRTTRNNGIVHKHYIHFK